MKPARMDADTPSSFFLGISLHASSLEAGLGDGFQLSLSDLGQSLEHDGSAPAVLQALRQVFTNAQEIANDLTGKIIAAGVALPAQVNPAPPRMGQVTLAVESNPMWEGVAVADWLQQELGAPFVVESDVIAAAVAELKIGAARGAQEALIIKIDSAVKAAYWRNGEFVRGANGFFGNIGHIATGNSDLPCSCGHLGCLEASVATEAILDRFFAALEAAELELEDEKIPESAEDVFALSEQNHAVARAVLDDVAFDLGAGIASVANIINPSKIVITGDAAYWHPGFLQRAFDDARQRMLSGCAKSVQLVAGTITIGADMIGAMMLAKQKFDSP